MHRLILRRVTAATLLAFALWSPVNAHCIIVNRFFPATLIVDDPCVNDELSIPTIAAFKNGDVISPRARASYGLETSTQVYRLNVSYWHLPDIVGEPEHVS